MRRGVGSLRRRRGEVQPVGTRSRAESSSVSRGAGGRERPLSERQRDWDHREPVAGDQGVHVLLVPVLGEQQRWLTAEPVPRSRADRLRLAAGCLEDELDAECRGNSAYEAMREQRRLHDKRRLGGPTKPYIPPPIPAGEVSVGYNRMLWTALRRKAAYLPG